MSKRQLAILFIAITALLSGCDNFQSSADTVILDLDAIANATGQAAVIKQQIEQANNELNSQLNVISKNLNDQLEDEKKKMGKKPTADDQQKLQQLTILANQKMQQSKQLASQKSQQYQATLIQKLRQEVSPIAEEIARERGASVVLTANNAMLWFNPEVDITDEVIAQIRSQPAETNEIDDDPDDVSGSESQNDTAAETQPATDVSSQ